MNALIGYLLIIIFFGFFLFNEMKKVSQAKASPENKIAIFVISMVFLLFFLINVLIDGLSPGNAFTRSLFWIIGISVVKELFELAIKRSEYSSSSLWADVYGIVYGSILIGLCTTIVRFVELIKAGG